MSGVVEWFVDIDICNRGNVDEVLYMKVHKQSVQKSDLCWRSIVGK